MTTFRQELDAVKSGKTPLAEAAKNLYDVMTDEEKLGLLDGDAWPTEFFMRMLSEGYCVRPHQAAGVDRLGVPGILFSDGPRGILSGTAFPAASARATSFDPALEEELGVAMGKELRALGGNYFGGVCINLAPNPRWGRMQESYGEDPLLVGSMGAALSRGVGHNVVACAKHFALNSMENMRFQVDVTCAEDVLHECFLPHFRQCLEEGGAESIMSAYNQVNGHYCGENTDLLNGVVRDIWGYDDVIITSDWLFGLRDAAKSVKAGLDIEMPFCSVRSTHLMKSLGNGSAEWSDVDRICQRILRFQLKFAARIANNPAPAASVVRSNPHRELAKKAASASMVLLKNQTKEGKALLPLQKQVKRLLVVGELAVSTQTGDEGSSAVTDPAVVSPMAGLKNQKGVTVEYLDGKDILAVQKASVNADAIFVLVGYTGRDEGEYVLSTDAQTVSTVMPNLFPNAMMAGTATWALAKISTLWGAYKGKPPVWGGDRRSMRLNGVDEQLVSAVAEFAPEKMIIGVECSGPVILPRAARNDAAAILITGYGGSQFGNALREVLFGEAEPSGRLAYGIVESELDVPDIDMSASAVVYDRFWGYRLSQKKGKKQAFPFGFGLGYGDLQFSNLAAPKNVGERFFEVGVTVKNNGQYASSGVVQIYLGKAEGRKDNDYERVLVGFARTPALKACGEAKIQVPCRLDPVAHWISSQKGFQATEGKYTLAAARYEGDEQALTESVKVSDVKWDVKNKA